MIPGSVSKVSEGILACADAIKVYNDLVRVTGTGTINTINPGLGTAQGQFLMIVPIDGTIRLGNAGNILGSLTIPRYAVATLIFSKPLQKWLLQFASGPAPFSSGGDGCCEDIDAGGDEDGDCDIDGNGDIDGEEGEDGDMTAKTVYIPFDQSNFVADGGTWTINPDQLVANFYYIHGKRVTLNLYVYGVSIGPAGTVRVIRMKLPQEICALAPIGGASLAKNGPAVFVGTAVVSDGASQPIVNAQTAYCAVLQATDAGSGHIPGAHLGIALTSGNWPATPPLGYAIFCTITYILA